jgi:hypothetical protein
MGQVADRLHSGEWLPDNALAGTVDDGYRHFLDVAYPVFAAHGIPVAVCLVTDFVERKCWLWFGRVTCAFLRSEWLEAKLELPAVQPVQTIHRRSLKEIGTAGLRRGDLAITIVGYQPTRGFRIRSVQGSRRQELRPGNLRTTAR